MLTTTKFIFVLVTLFHVKCQKVPLKENDAESSRIVNGNKASPGQFPFAVSMQTILFRGIHAHSCTLSLITSKTCLGAAHCAYGEDGVTRTPPKKLCGIVGSIEQIPDAKCHKYSEVFVHEDYTTGTEEALNDIATFIFVEEMQIDKTSVDIIPLLANTEIEESTIIALGWGNLYTYDDEDSPKILRYVEINLLPIEECQVTDSQLCLATEGKGVCAGDSGGPNIISSGGKKIQIGISSYVVGDCATEFSVAVAVGAYTEWIEEHSVGTPIFVSE